MLGNHNQEVKNHGRGGSMICCKLKVIEQMAAGTGLSGIYEDLTIQGVSYANGTKCSINNTVDC